MKHAIFTICAKNYLAQAITLRESVLKYNPNIDFYLFLSDLNDQKEITPSYLIELDDVWIKDWRRMAFKYNVIEFSTSIKPFCFNKLFAESYDKVIYLDPDIYVIQNLDCIFDMLNDKSIVLSPHYCNIQTDYTGSITEEEVLFVGIYNLGFCAIKKDTAGRKIINWWSNRLSNKCYADHNDALHVDQRWMDFIPCFFPNETLITHDMGVNPAIWNLHERELKITSKGDYIIQNIESKEVFDLKFFHFSGFDPFNSAILNRRHPKYGKKQFPSLIPLIDEYVEAVYRNGYETFSKLNYSFNAFENNENIMPLHRRLFRATESENIDPNPFLETSTIYQQLSMGKLLSGVKGTAFKVIKTEETTQKGKLVKLVLWGLKLTKRIFGIRYYASLLSNLKYVIKFESQTFLMKK